MFIHTASVWQIATDPFFLNIVKEVTVESDSRELPVSGLNDYAIYFVRVKIVNQRGLSSRWSNVVRYRTAAYWDGTFEYNGAIDFGSPLENLRWS